MSEDENQEVTLKKTSFWTKNKSYIMIGIMALCFVVAYTQNFNKTQTGTLFTVLFVFATLAFIIVTFKASPLLGQTDEFAKDPNYYFQFVKEYYSKPTYPRLHMDLTWTGRSLYYPLVQPSLVFLELFERRLQEPMICIIRIMRNGEQIRALFKSTWRDFIHNFFFRMKLAGMLPAGGERLNIIGKDGKPISMPGEYIDLLQDRGVI